MSWARLLPVAKIFSIPRAFDAHQSSRFFLRLSPIWRLRDLLAPLHSLRAGLDFLVSIKTTDLDDIQWSCGRIGEVGQTALNTAPFTFCHASSTFQGGWVLMDSFTLFISAWSLLGCEMAQWLELEFTDQKVRGSKATSASRLPLSRLRVAWQLGTERVLQLNDYLHSEVTAFDPFSVVRLLTLYTFNNNNNRSAATPSRCLAAIPTERSTRAGMLPGCPSLGRRRGEEVEFEPRTFLSVNLRYNH
ncbi:hypothetical protein CSKR_106781 [Clonorchis sinensis]|uniref:Uncharacterized protein n=1 Tax=Clonorchis sinensis TaxID=79923 RepID=A0A419PUM4_CLOSI|nr:hypothetical protein CSKR_106781 [Clonorchis sinensis]